MTTLENGEEYIDSDIGDDEGIAAHNPRRSGSCATFHGVLQAFQDAISEWSCDDLKPISACKSCGFASPITMERLRRTL